MKDIPLKSVKGRNVFPGIRKLLDGPAILDPRELDGPVSLPDGTILYPGGVTVKVYPDGRRVTTYPEDWTEFDTVTEHPDGRIVTVYRDGIIITDHPDGRIVTVTPEGMTVTRYPDGKIVEEAADGTTTTRYPSGLVEVEFIDGSLVVYPGDDSQWWFPPKVLIELPNGGEEWGYDPPPYGSYVSPDGDVVPFDPNTGELLG